MGKEERGKKRARERRRKGRVKAQGMERREERAVARGRKARRKEGEGKAAREKGSQAWKGGKGKDAKKARRNGKKENGKGKRGRKRRGEREAGTTIMLSVYRNPRRGGEEWHGKAGRNMRWENGNRRSPGTEEKGNSDTGDEGGRERKEET